jgi:hypothetical protein
LITWASGSSSASGERTTNDRRGLALALVGDLELGEHGEDRVRPAEDQRVVFLEHHRAPLAHLFDPRVESGGEDTDQGADDEEAAEGDQQHHREKGPVAFVFGDRAGVESVQQAFERLADDAVVSAGAVRGEVADQDDRGEERDQRQRRQRQPADQGRRAPRHRVVEGVANALVQGRACRHGRGGYVGRGVSGEGCRYPFGRPDPSNATPGPELGVRPERVV